MGNVQRLMMKKPDLLATSMRNGEMGSGPNLSSAESTRDTEETGLDLPVESACNGERGLGPNLSSDKHAHDAAGLDLPVESAHYGEMGPGPNLLSAQSARDAVAKSAHNATERGPEPDMEQPATRYLPTTSAITPPEAFHSS